MYLFLDIYCKHCKELHYISEFRFGTTTYRIGTTLHGVKWHDLKFLVNHLWLIMQKSNAARNHKRTYEKDRSE